MTPLHLLGPDDQNEMQHIFYHVMPLATASPPGNTKGIIIAPLHLVFFAR